MPTNSSPPIAALRLSAKSSTAGLGDKVTVFATGGVAPYTYSVLSGGGTFSSSTGPTATFTTPVTPATVVIQVSDTTRTTSQFSIKVEVGASLSPNDTLFTQLAGLSNSAHTDIDAPGAWGIHTDCTSTTVGILDTGIDYNHPDLKDNIFVNTNESASKSTNNSDDDGNGFKDDYHGWNFVNNTNNASDNNFHGTHVAGTIGAVGNNSTGVTGICWRAALLPLKFLDADGNGYTSDAISAINYGIKMGVKVFNASFGGGPQDNLFKEAIDKAHAAGAVFVAAAGNESTNNDTTPHYPSSYASVNLIAVAATSTTSDQLASYSNYGTTSVHIAAPGSNILSTFPTTVSAEMTRIGKTTAYEKISGTSMATPHVAGVAALLMSFDPSLTPTQVKSRILDSADIISDLSSKVQNGRRLNARKALYRP